MSKKQKGQAIGLVLLIALVVTQVVGASQPKLGKAPEWALNEYGVWACVARTNGLHPNWVYTNAAENRPASKFEYWPAVDCVAVDLEKDKKSTPTPTSTLPGITETAWPATPSPTNTLNPGQSNLVTAVNPAGKEHQTSGNSGALGNTQNTATPTLLPTNTLVPSAEPTDPPTPVPTATCIANPAGNCPPGQQP